MEAPRPPAAKVIKTADDVKAWQRSGAYKEVKGFIMDMAGRVTGVDNDGPAGLETGATVGAIVAALDEMNRWVDEIPLQDMASQRFGNKAYRDWHQRLRENSARHMTAALEAGQCATGGEHAAELAIYWEDAFGNPTRIDYGTGHEMHFAVVLMLIQKLGCVPEDQKPLLVTQCFHRYMVLMRRMQGQYSMEPAGSHGVWGLDDYHHLPFLWGAAQLIGNPLGLEAKNLTTEAAGNRAKYLYHDGIAWILENKRGPFHEHSPTLHSVCQLTWQRIKDGMSKMYCGEVLNKWPIVQHLPFGTLLRWEPQPPAAQPAAAPPAAPAAAPPAAAAGSG